MKTFAPLALAILAGCATTTASWHGPTPSQGGVRHLLIYRASCYYDMIPGQDNECFLPQIRQMQVRNLRCTAEPPVRDVERARATCTFTSRVSYTPKGPTQAFWMTSASFWLEQRPGEKPVWHIFEAYRAEPLADKISSSRPSRSAA
jgi:hypothetical protein